jgi:two-component system, OmpR family, sensor histidine kinase KdpD
VTDFARTGVRAAASSAAVAGVTGAVFALRPVAPVVSLGVLYLLAVLPVAVLWGLRYALPVALASMLAFNFFFLAPVHSFRLRDSENWVALAVYLTTAVVVSELAARGRRRAEEAEQRRREAEFAAEVSVALLEAASVQSQLGQIASRVAGVLGASRVRIELDSVRRPDSGETAHPLRIGERRIGTVFVNAGPGGDPAIRERVLAALAALLAYAADRERLGRRAVDAEALRRSDAVKTTILRTLSHDLRSPLTAIGAAGEVLQGGDVSEAERTELVATVRAEAERLTRLVANVLDLSRLEARAANPRPELWTADGLVARALEALGSAGERVDVTLPAESPPVSVDAAQVERALVNLLENALKYSPVEERVSVDIEALDGEVVVRVVDHGPGIAPRDLARIFEAFERGSSAGDGTGLGLAIARGFVQANGGRLWAESEPGRGASFVVAFPVARTPAPVLR